MKRRSVAVLCLLTLFALAACGARETPPVPASAIRPAVFSEDAQAVLELLNGTEEALIFFDYTVEEPVRSVSTEVWKYEDGGWKQSGHVFGNIEPGEYRMGFRLTSSGYEIFDISETGHNTYTYRDTVDFGGCAATFGTQLGDSREIVCGEEIPLWLKTGSSGGSIAGDPEDFRSIDCTAGLAVTITFSDTPID